MGLHVPIVAVPKLAIEDVSKIRVNKINFMAKKHIKEKEKVLFNYMFEVFLREDYEDVYRFRDEE